MLLAILILQIVCIIAVALGIIVEFRFQADFGFIFVTAGSFAFALSEKFDKYRIKRYIKRNNKNQSNYENH